MADRQIGNIKVSLTKLKWQILHTCIGVPPFPGPK